MRTMRPSIWPRLSILFSLLLLFAVLLTGLTRAQTANSREILATKSREHQVGRENFPLIRRNPVDWVPQQVLSTPKGATPPAPRNLALSSIKPARNLVHQHVAQNKTLPTIVGQQGPTREQELRYAVVVDCGSSGTRVQIFYWLVTSIGQHDPNSESHQLDQLAYRIETLRDTTTGQPRSLRIRPGLASVRDNPDAASDYLVPIMRFASTWVPTAEQHRTPVYIMGTAGLRTLTPVQQTSILADITRDLSQEFAFRPITAEIISGLDEGFYQWLSINTLARRLGPGYDQARATPPSARSRRLGLIEMGGYSAQVAFEAGLQVDALVRRRLKHSPAAWHAYRASSRQLELGGHRSPTRVFSVSFLGFGSDVVRQWAVDLLVRDSLNYLRQFGHLATLRSQQQVDATRQAQLSLDDPCLPRDAEETMVKPLSLLDDHARTLNHNLATGEPEFQVRLRGRGNFVACLGLLKRLILVAKIEQTTCYSGGGNERDTSKVCEAPLIGINFLPWNELQFVGLGELYYTTDTMLRASGRFNGHLVRWEAMSICGKSLELINAQYPGEDKFTRRRNQLACFKATWILAWLAVGLRMPMDVPPTHKWAANFTTTNRVDGQEVDWKLGAVLAKTVAIASAAGSGGDGTPSMVYAAG